MLHILYGTAGSGKTTKLTESILTDLQSSRPAYLIIPEQQANLTERTVLPKLPAGNRLLFTLAGFSRLAELAEKRFGGGTGYTLSEGIRTLLLWRSLRDMTGVLSEYGSVSPRSDIHLTSLLLSAVDELHIAGTTPEELECAAKKLPAGSVLAGKLSDLALLSAAFGAQLESLQKKGSTDALERLAALLEKENLFGGANVYIDSFTSFTAEEYRVLSAILRQADNVTVSLPTDALVSGNPAFAGINETVRKLRHLAGDEGVAVTDEYLPGTRRTDRPELSVLIRSLWNLSVTPDTREDIATDKRGAVTLLRCTNCYAEAEAISLHILDLVHRGYRYGDIAITVRDTATWRGVLDAALARRGIPYYFSEKTALLEQPLSRLVLSSLSAVVHGFPGTDILMLLKTGLCPVRADEADLFEQYVFAWNLTGAAFTEPQWTRSPDSFSTGRITDRGQAILDAANRVREAIMTPLLLLHTALSGEKTLPEFCRALYEYLENLHVAKACADRAEAELASGYPKEAGETLRVYDTLVSLLVQCSALLPDLRLNAEEFATVLHLLFAKEEIASVPSLHDSVTVGSAATLRVENITVSFVAGLCEGEFPRVLSENGLLSEAERQQMIALNLKLNSDSKRDSADELLYVWRAMTKPSDLLYLSTQRTDTDGSVKAPSVVWNRVLFLLPYLQEKIRDFDLRLLDAEPPASPAGDGQESATDIKPEEDGLYTRLLPSPGDLSPALTETLFGNELYLSQSQISAFVGCPYRYYCQYVLNLRKKEPLRVAAADTGIFFHYVLEQYVKSGMQADGGFSLPPEEDSDAIAETIVQKYLRDTGTDRMADMGTLHQLSRLRNLSVFVIRDIRNELEKSAFTPCALELGINDRGKDAAAPYTIPLEDKKCLKLTGIVDRVDVFRQDGTDYLLTMDYKSGSKVFSPEDVRDGTDLQLFLYLFALCRKSNVKPAGALYLSVAVEKGKPEMQRTGLLLNDRSVLSARNSEMNPAYLAGIRENNGELSGKALTPADGFKSMEADMQETMRRIGKDIFCGRAKRTPSVNACRYCPFFPSCPDAVHEKKNP